MLWMYLWIAGSMVFLSVLELVTVEAVTASWLMGLIVVQEITSPRYLVPRWRSHLRIFTTVGIVGITVMKLYTISGV